MLQVSTLRKVAIAVVGLGVVLALLFATGVLRLNRRAGPRDDAKGRRIDSLGYFADSILDEDRARAGVTRALEGQVDPKMLVVYHPLGWSGGLEDAQITTPWNEVRLIDARGEVRHRWKVNPFFIDKKEVSTARMIEDGTLLVLQNDAGIAKLRWDGRVLWKVMGLFHHEIATDAQRRVYANIERRTIASLYGVGLPIRDHGVAVFDENGEPLRELWLSESLLRYPAYRIAFQEQMARRRERKRTGFIDIFHANSVQPIPAYRDRWNEGDLLISVRNLNIIVVIDQNDGRLRWAWGEQELQHQHSPSPSRDGTFVVFDNGHKREFSRILEVVPSSNEIRWAYQRPQPPNKFYSRIRGEVEWIASSDTFMVYSTQRGRIFELDRKGEIVWEFFSPDIWNDKRVPIRGHRLTGALLRKVQARLEADRP